MNYWGISKGLYNFKLEMAAMNEQQGTIEFSFQLFVALR